MAVGFTKTVGYQAVGCRAYRHCGHKPLGSGPRLTRDGREIAAETPSHRGIASEVIGPEQARADRFAVIRTVVVVRRGTTGTGSCIRGSR